MKDTNRRQIPPKLRALNNPLRMSIYELIRDGAKTAPELAEILDENRLNLYHHLDSLEDANLIKSSYGSNRVKVYNLTEETKDSHVINSFDTGSNIGTQTYVLSPPDEDKQYRKFKHLINEIAKLGSVDIEEDTEILQVQITTQESKVIQFKRNKLESIKNRKKKRDRA